MCFSVYYKNFILRHPALFRTVQRALSSLVGLKGRGREAMLRDAKNAEDMVRLYDGADNPIGKAYTLDDVLRMVRATGLIPLGHRRSFFPARAIPLPVPRRLHRQLDRHCGLLVMVRAYKPC